MMTASTAAAAPADDLHQYAVPKVEAPTLAVVGSDNRFPVRRVYCVGSNYRCGKQWLLVFSSCESWLIAAPHVFGLSRRSLSPLFLLIRQQLCRLSRDGAISTPSYQNDPGPLQVIPCETRGF